MSSVVDRIFGWFNGSRKEEEPVAEEEQLAALEEEQAPGLRSEEYVYGQPDEPVGEEERTPDFDYDDEVYDDHEQPEEQVDEREHTPAFRHKHRFSFLQELDESEESPAMKPSWLREKKEES